MTKIYTPEEAQQKLRIGRTCFYKLLREGKIKALKNGRRYLIPESSIQVFIETELMMQEKKGGEEVCQEPIEREVDVVTEKVQL